MSRLGEISFWLSLGLAAGVVLLLAVVLGAALLGLGGGGDGPR